MLKAAIAWLYFVPLLTLRRVNHSCSDARKTGMLQGTQPPVSSEQGDARSWTTLYWTEIPAYVCLLCTNYSAFTLARVWKYPTPLRPRMSDYVGELSSPPSTLPPL